MNSAILFYLLAFLLIGSSLMVVLSKDIYRASFWLVGFFLFFAGLLLTLHAPFLALTEIIVYSGAIAVMIIFAVMLTGKYAKVLIAAIFIIEIVLIIKDVPEFKNFAFAFASGSNARAVGLLCWQKGGNNDRFYRIYNFTADSFGYRHDRDGQYVRSTVFSFCCCCCCR